MCQEDRAGMCLSTGSGSVSGLEIFVCASQLTWFPQGSGTPPPAFFLFLSYDALQSRPICLGPLSTCQPPARNEGRTL